MTISIDDELFRRAAELAGPDFNAAELVREALRLFVRIESAKRLAALGGRATHMRDIPRRAPDGPQ
jgi:hypothetical protein